MSVQAPVFIKKIKCPRHFMLIKGCYPFVMERDPALRNIKEADAKALGVSLWRKKKDARGQWIINKASYFQPEMSAAHIRETVYDSSVGMCQMCRRCVNRA